METEKEKMLSGELYNASDSELSQERTQTRELLLKLNSDLAKNDPEIFRKLFPNASQKTIIQPPFYCDYGYNIYTGENVFFNFNCVLLDVAPIKIGSNTLIAPNVQIYTATHPRDFEKRRSLLESGKRITIGEDCWIGGGAIILPGITIGDRSIIGAGAVVTKDVSSDTNVVGNPAKPI